MTQREFYSAVINNQMDGTEITDEMVAFATDAIAKLDARNAKRSSTPSKAQIANEPIKAHILEVLTSEPQTASEIAQKCEISTQKASGLLSRMSDLKVSEVKVKGKGKVKGYSL